MSKHSLAQPDEQYHQNHIGLCLRALALIFFLPVSAQPALTLNSTEAISGEAESVGDDVVAAADLPPEEF